VGRAARRTAAPHAIAERIHALDFAAGHALMLAPQLL
jgi:hypothetical protein